MMKFLWILTMFCCLVYGQTININFKNMDIQKLIEVTSLTISKSILNPYNIQARINYSSTRIHNDNDLLSILKATLQSNGYDLLLQDNIYKVIKSDNLRTQLFELKHANAKELLKVINDLNYKDINASIIEDLNALFVVAKIEQMNKLSRLIKRLDIKRRQVYVKARIIEVNNEKLHHVGVQYGIFKSKSNHSELFTFSSSLNGLVGSLSKSPINQSTLFSSTSMLALGASIHLLKQHHAINIISEPSILCINNKESSIYVGEKKSIRTDSSISESGASKESFVREDTGLTLKVIPLISKNNNVLLNIQTQIENFSQTNTTNNQPDTSTKQVNTTAIVQNGESVVIGGLIENRVENVKHDIPLLSEIPILGNLFQNENNIKSKKSLVIIITPYIVQENSNLTKLREELAQLYLLEQEYLNQGLMILKKDQKNKIKENSSNLHEERMKALGL